MKVVINKFIPFKGYIAMAMCPFIFARKELNKYILNHELIHGEQQKELLFISFYIVYCVEYIIKLCITLSHERAYRSISFEQEASINEYDLNYIPTRNHYSWIKYLFKLTLK